jgi:hypothetical protein
MAGAPQDEGEMPEAGEVFGIELEGLSGEDQQFEMTRRFVRFGGAASGRVARAPRGVPPRSIVRSAVAAAASRWAPGLFRLWRRGRPYRPRRPGWWYRPRTAGPPYPWPTPPAPMQPDWQQRGPAEPASPDSAPSVSSSGSGSGQPSPQADGGGPESDASGASIPSSGRWTREGGQLIIHF